MIREQTSSLFLCPKEHIHVNIPRHLTINLIKTIIGECNERQTNGRFTGRKVR